MKGFNLDDFMEIVEELKEKTIVVEGKKDKAALVNLGLPDVIAIDRKPLIKVVENLEKHTAEKSAYPDGYKEVVLLTDFDRQGAKLASRLKFLMEKYKIRVNARLRHEVRKFGKNKIEDFSKVFAFGEKNRITKRGDIYVKVSSYVNKIHNKSHYKGERCYRETRCDWGDFWPDRGIAGF